MGIDRERLRDLCCDLRKRKEREGAPEESNTGVRKERDGLGLWVWGVSRGNSVFVNGIL